MARSDAVPMLALMVEDTHKELRVRVGGSTSKNLCIPKCTPELRELLRKFTGPEFMPWLIEWGRLWLITDMAQRLSARMYGANEMVALKQSTTCIIEQEPSLRSIVENVYQSDTVQIGTPKPRNVEVYSKPYNFLVAYDDRPCSCNQCVLLTTPAVMDRRRLQVYVTEVGSGGGVMRALVTEPYVKAFRPDAAAIAATWEQVKSNLAGGNSSATPSSQPSTYKPAAAYPPVPVGCWNPGCKNMSGVSEASLCTKMCGRCCRARYFSLECQKEDWRRHQESKHLEGCRVP
jgi:hypothetical protein